jgi:HTH-type transcriptional regulator/antitoxin HigA
MHETAKKVTPQAYHKLGLGDFIEEERNTLDLSQEELADVLDISTKHLNEIINDKRPLSFELCVLLGELFGPSTEYWSKLDLEFRIKNSVLDKKKEEVEIKSRLYRAMPVLELVKKKWIKQTKDFEKLKSEVCKFWNLKEFDIEEIEKCASVINLKTRIKDKNHEKLNFNSLKTWHQYVYHLSEDVEVEKYNKTKLEKLSDRILDFTGDKNDISNFIENLNDCGVKFLVCEHLQKTYLDGAVFFHKKNPVIVYTSRFNRLDNFWWTVCHEIGHLLLEHIKDESSIIVDSNIESQNDISTEEKQADEFAGKMLKKTDILNHFTSIGSYITEDRVVNYSEENNLHPSIVVGMLAHEGHVSYVNKNRFNEPVLDILEAYL